MATGRPDGVDQDQQADDGGLKPPYSAVPGFVLSFFVVVSFAGLVMSIVAAVKSKRAGRVSKLAIAGTIIGALVSLVTVLAVVAGAGLISDLIGVCTELGPGVHDVGDSTYVCDA